MQFMNIPADLPRLKGYRSPREVIAYAVWPYHRFALSTADVEDLLAPQADHRAHKGLNNAIEVSHRPTRKREKIFGRFKSHRQAQRILSAHDQINLIFRRRRDQLTAKSNRGPRSSTWQYLVRSSAWDKTSMTV